MIGLRLPLDLGRVFPHTRLMLNNAPSVPPDDPGPDLDLISCPWSIILDALRSWCPAIRNLTLPAQGMIIGDVKAYADGCRYGYILRVDGSRATPTFAGWAARVLDEYLGRHGAEREVPAESDRYRAVVEPAQTIVAEHAAYGVEA